MLALVHSKSESLFSNFHFQKTVYSFVKVDESRQSSHPNNSREHQIFIYMAFPKNLTSLLGDLKSSTLVCVFVGMPYKSLSTTQVPQRTGGRKTVVSLFYDLCLWPLHLPNLTIFSRLSQLGYFRQTRDSLKLSEF